MAWWRFRSSTCKLEMASQMVTWSEELFSSVWFSLKYVQIHHPGKSYGCFQMTFYLSSFSPAGQVSWVSQKGPLLAEMFCCCHLNNCRTRCPHFHFGRALQTMYAVLPSWWDVCDWHARCEHSLHNSGLCHLQEMFAPSTASTKPFFPTSPLTPSTAFLS